MAAKTEINAHVISKLLDRINNNTKQNFVLPKKYVFCINDSCSFRCKMCFNWTNKPHPELTYDDWIRKLEEINEYGSENVEINIIGGEPLEIPWVIDLIKHAKQLGFIVSLSTNGYHLNKTMVKKLCNSGLDDISISLDGFKASTHDYVRGINGSYDKLMEGMKLLQLYSNRPRINIQTLIMGYNIDEIIDLTKFVSKSKLVDKGITFMAVMKPNDNVSGNWRTNSELWPKDIPKTLKTIKKLIELKKKGYRILNSNKQLKGFYNYFKEPDLFVKNKPCNVKDFGAFLETTGNVYICRELGELGNIKQENIIDVLNSDISDITRLSMEKCTENCNYLINCFYQDEDENNDPVVSVTKPVSKSVLLQPDKKIKLHTNLKNELLNKSYKPNFCLLIISRGCHYKCKMCNYWKEDKKTTPTLTYDEITTIVDDLKRITDEDIVVHLIGGESMLFPRFVDVVKYIRSKGFRCSVSTNASLLTKSMAKKLIDADMTGIFVSLDSLDEKKHDYLRGTKGAYKKVMNAIDNLYEYKEKVKSKLCIGVTVTIMQHNLHDVIPIVDWANDNPKINDVFFNAVMQPFENQDQSKDWYKKEQYEMIWPQDLNEVQEVIEQLRERKKKGWKISNPSSQLKVVKQYFKTPWSYVKNLGIKCPRGDLALEVDACGNINMCFYDDPIGNIRETNLYNAWYSQKMLEIRERINTCSKDCDLAVNCFYMLKNITDYISED